jgi:hypothetical protein
MAEWMKEYDINDKVVFDRVLLLGTKDYTAIGRPVVETAKVLVVSDSLLMFLCCRFTLQLRSRLSRRK